MNWLRINPTGRDEGGIRTAAYRDMGTLEGFLDGRLTNRMSLLSWMVTVVPFLNSASSPFLNNPISAPAADPMTAPTPKPFRSLPLTAPTTPPSTAPRVAPETVSSPWFPGAWSVPCSSVGSDLSPFRRLDHCLDLSGRAIGQNNAVGCQQKFCTTLEVSGFMSR